MNGATTALLSLALVLSCDRESETAQTPALTPETSTMPVDSEPAPTPAETVIVFETNGGELRVPVEVVSTPARIQRGLMYRKHLAPDRGMLFVFSGDRVRSFWMKNTLISLDMLFVRSDLSVAGIERDTTPLSKQSRSVGIPTRYVLEVNGGWTAKHGIEAGAKLRFENLPEIENAPL